MTNKWRIFHRPIDVQYDFAVKIVQACCLLRNFVRERDGYNFEDTLHVIGVENTNEVINIGPGPATQIHDKFATYFVSEEGAINWQNNMI